MIRRLTAGVPARALWLLCLLLIGFLVAPLFAGDYVLTVHLSEDAPELPSEVEGHAIRYVRRGPYRKQ